MIVSAVAAAVVFYCHTHSNVMQRFLFKAQDSNMTSGDYALFAYSDLPTEATLRPWTAFDMTGEDVGYRMQAFGAQKQVHRMRWAVSELLGCS